MLRQEEIDARNDRHRRQEGNRAEVVGEAGCVGNPTAVLLSGTGHQQTVDKVGGPVHRGLGGLGGPGGAWAGAVGACATYPLVRVYRTPCVAN